MSKQPECKKYPKEWLAAAHDAVHLQWLETEPEKVQPCHVYLHGKWFAFRVDLATLDEAGMLVTLEGKEGDA